MARNRHLVLQSSSLLAVVLLVTVVLANLSGGPGSGAASGVSEATVGVPPTASAGFGNPVRNWSFEQDLSGWQVIGAADAGREPQGRTSGSCASVRARGPQPSRVGLAQPGVLRGAEAGRRFVAKAWVRSTAPGVKVTLRLVGAGAKPESSQASTTTLPGLAWRALIVDHRVGGRTDLAVEITAEDVPGGDALLLDEVTVREG